MLACANLLRKLRNPQKNRKFASKMKKNIGRTPFAPKWAPRGFDGHFDAKGRMLLNRPFAGVPDGCAYEWSKADDYLRQDGLSESAINAVMSELNEKHAELKA